MKRICSYPSCKNITANTNSRCELHQPEARERNRTSTTDNQDIYNSNKWKKLRAKKAKANPLCEECIKHNIVKPVDVVDHIKEISDYPELAYTYSNLRSLCHMCHNLKTISERNKREHPTEVRASDLFNNILNRNKGE